MNDKPQRKVYRVCEYRFYIIQTRNICIAFVALMWGAFWACNVDEATKRESARAIELARINAPGYRLVEVK